MIKRVLLTGGSGFVGRHCIAPLTARGYEVHAVTGRRSSEGGGACWHQADLLDEGQRCALVERIRPTHLLHQAWYAVPGKYWNSEENLRWVQASLGLMQAFAMAGGRRLVMAGTCAEYDWNHGRCVESGTPLVPATLYGACKHALQTMLTAWCRRAGISSAWGRVFSLYGPYEHPHRLVASVITALLRGKGVVCNHGGLVRDYMHVADVADAFVAIIDGDIEGPVNIGTGIGVALKDIVEKIGAKTGRADLVRFDARPASADEPAVLLADTARLDRTGWKPRFNLDSGLDDAIAWWRSSFGEGGEEAKPIAAISTHTKS